MNLYKGYVATKNKKSIDKFKGVPADQLKTLEEAQALPEYAGVLAEDTILVDIDDFDQSEVMLRMVKDMDLQCKVIKTTRGKHFLFRNADMVGSNKTHTTLACGLIADIKIGTRNSIEVLKFEGEERPVLYDIKEGSEYQEIPKWLTPVKTDKKEFFGMKNGDGRNQILYDYIIDLCKGGFSKEEGREAIRILNQYVLAEPMSENELETVLRDESFDNIKQGGKFQFDEFGDMMIQQHYIKRINERLHIYRDGIYVSGNRYIENAMSKMNKKIPAVKRTEVLKYLDINILDNTPTWMSNNLIAFENGILDIESDSNELLPFNPAYIILNKIPWNYDPEAYDEATDQMLDRITCGDKQIRSVLEEMVGYCFYRANTFRKSFILTGKGKNGKSTFLRMLQYTLDKDSDKNVSTLSLQDFSGRFDTAQLYERLANIGDDIPESEFSGNGLSIFKKAVSGEALGVENKGENKFTMKPYAKLLFAANTIPNFRTASFTAIKDRLIIIPFNARFDKADGNYNPAIFSDLRRQEAVEYIIRLGVEGLRRLFDHQEFTEVAAAQKELDEMELDNDSILSWLDSLKISDDEDQNSVIDRFVINRPLKDIYQNYNEYCLSNGIRDMDIITKRNFSKKLMDRFKIKKTRLNDKNRKTTFEWDSPTR